jgi:predicted RNA-binding protein associated with RNAse of E/G family
MDHALDILVTPDISEWKLHDEDELEEARALGLFSTSLVQQIRAVGEQIVKRIEAKTFTLTEGWDTWRPPTEWVIPDLLEGWKKVKLDA